METFYVTKTKPLVYENAPETFNGEGYTSTIVLAVGAWYGILAVASGFFHTFHGLESRGMHLKVDVPIRGLAKNMTTLRKAYPI